MIPAVRLATHEIEDLVKVRSREARLKRLQQVREQSSQFAKNIRDARKAKEEKLSKAMEAKLKRQFDAELKTLIQGMEKDALACLEKFGSAHERARQENEENLEEQRQQKLSQYRKKAQRLGKDALRELKIHQQETSAEKNRRILLRNQALDAESVRSTYIASLPPVKVLATQPPTEEPPKVIRFDKSTLFQTEYVIKEKIVEPITSPLDARKAALLSEAEDQEIARRKEEQKQENAKKVKARGKEALMREKSHSNYLRLLEELDKMEKEPEKNWDVESTVTSVEQTNHSISPRPMSPQSSGSSCLLESNSESKRARDQFYASQETTGTYRNLPTTSEVVPVNRPVYFPRLPSLPPPLSQKDSQQLSEIGQLLKELKDEQERLISGDQASYAKGMNHSEALSEESKQQTSSSHASTNSSGGVVIFSDDDVRIRFDVAEKSSDSSDSECRKNLANVLNVIRKERARLDTILESSNKPIKRPGILRKSAPLPDSCTSTPVPVNTVKPRTANDERQQVLKHYVQKLLQMKRQEVQELSVGSCSSSSVMSTPKPVAGSIPSHRVQQTTPEVKDWSKRTESSSSAYDSPATEQSSSRISNGSSLPLGAEASAYRRSDAGKWDSNCPLTLGPLLDVYNDVYQAYNQRLRLVTEERRIPQDGPVPWPETLTESSFMSLTLSATSTERSAVSRQRFPGDASSFSVELSLSSSSSSGNTSRPASVREWEKLSATKSSLRSSSSSTSISELKSSRASSTTSSQEISMPDVDEALRRLGMPSMQSVLRR